jgi:hypothetical protein
MHHHTQYQHENLSLSPQQSSTSDADETLTPPPCLNRGVVCFFYEIDLITSYDTLLFFLSIECDCCHENCEEKKATEKETERSK